MQVKIIPLCYKSYNYGGTLQYLALSKAVEFMGYECSVLDCHSIEHRIFPEKKDKKSVYRRICEKIYRIFVKRYTKLFLKNFNQRFEKRNENFDLFREKFVRAEFVAKDEKIFPKKSVFISGSDQIWNPWYACNTHFFSFVENNAKKIVYGASLGCKTLNSQEIKEYKTRLQNCNYISVREHDAIEIANLLTATAVPVVVCDPVFLMKRSFWDSYTQNIKCESQIFCYFIGTSLKNRKIAKKIARKRQEELTSIPFITQKFFPGEHFSDVQLNDADPIVFLSHIKNSSLIVTDSFHATAFAILFHKDFVVLDREPGESSMLSRITTLLNSLNLKDRLITKISDIESMNPINWDVVDVHINTFRDYSINWLKKSLES